MKYFYLLAATLSLAAALPVTPAINDNETNNLKIRFEFARPRPEGIEPDPAAILNPVVGPGLVNGGRGGYNAPKGPTDLNALLGGEPPKH